jgi:hypothetical protein
MDQNNIGRVCCHIPCSLMGSLMSCYVSWRSQNMVVKSLEVKLYSGSRNQKFYLFSIFLNLSCHNGYMTIYVIVVFLISNFISHMFI